MTPLTSHSSTMPCTAPSHLSLEYIFSQEIPFLPADFNVIWVQFTICITCIKMTNISLTLPDEWEKWPMKYNSGHLKYPPAGSYWAVCSRLERAGLLQQSNVLQQFLTAWEEWFPPSIKQRFRLQSEKNLFPVGRVLMYLFTPQVAHKTDFCQIAVCIPLVTAN